MLQLQDKGITVRTTVGPEGNRLLIELQGVIVGEAYRLGRSYALNSAVQEEPTAEVTLQATTDSSSRVWHRRLGHLSSQSLQRVHAVTSGVSEPIRELKEACEACILTKTVRVVNRNTPERATEPLQRVHTDFWGPYSVPTLLGETYILTFTDDFTRKSWVYFTKSRGQLRTLFSQYRALAELESGHKIRVIRCDNASEYRSLGDLFQRDYGIQFEYTTPYTPEQNGVAERLNRSLITMARTMLLDAKLPVRFWGDAVATACYLRNRTPIGPEGKTPEEAYSGKKPYIGHLKAYGCVAYAHLPEEKRHKLDSTAVRTCLIGYMPTSRQYKLYYPDSKRIIVSTAPRFQEEKRLEWDWEEEPIGEETTPFDPMEPDPIPEAPVATEVAQTEESPRGAELEGQSNTSEPEEPEEPEEPTDPGSQETPVRRSGRTRKAPVRWEPVGKGEPSKPVDQAFSATTIPIPKTYAEAMADPLNKAYWEQAVREELAKLQALDTWEYAELPPGKKAVSCKWVFTVKYTPTGLIDHYKARLVARGFSQVPGDDYLETFSPTIRAESLRILLALGALENLEIRQIDVVSAYPRSKLHATVYMNPPVALNCPKNTVLLLHQSLYGLKQSGREWYIEACNGLEKLGFTPCFSEPSIFVNADKSLIIGLYVDDMIILGAKLQAVEQVIQGISTLWEIKDLGDVSLILGIQVRRDRQKRLLSLDQSTYIQELIKRFGLGDAKPISSPVTDRNALISGLSNEI